MQRDRFLDYKIQILQCHGFADYQIQYNSPGLNRESISSQVLNIVISGVVFRINL
jgi:hypothetical protein